MPEASSLNNNVRLLRVKPRHGLVVFYSSVRALFLRELQTRFGHYRLGYIWALLEPAFNVVLMLLLFSAILHRTLPGIPYSLFLLNGILPYYVFMRSATQSLSAISANKGLLAYRSVKPIDTVVARTFLEAGLYFICYIFLNLTLIWFGVEISFAQLPLLLGLWVVLLFLTLGFASIMMVVGELFTEIGKFISASFVILYFISGVIFPLHLVPPQYLHFFMWNPIAHILELMRASVSLSYTPVLGTSMSYILFCTLVTFFLGLLLCQATQKRMLKSK